MPPRRIACSLQSHAMPSTCVLPCLKTSKVPSRQHSSAHGKMSSASEHPKHLIAVQHDCHMLCQAEPCRRARQLGARRVVAI